MHLSKNDKNYRLTIMDYPSGFILKLPTSDFPYLIEDEFLTMHLASLVKIKTVPFGLIKMKDNKFAYITKRIDRIGEKKIAMEDFCQLGEKLNRT